MTLMISIEVDQSGKIETQQDTILAYANDERYAVCIPSRVKREVLNSLRKQGRSKPRAVLWLFAASLFLLLRDVLNRVSEVTIDFEYVGYDADIKSMLLRFARNHGVQVEPDVLRFGAIGKHSNAHAQAIGVFRGRIKVNRVVTGNELFALMGGKKSTDHPLKRVA